MATGPQDNNVNWWNHLKSPFNDFKAFQDSCDGCGTLRIGVYCGLSLRGIDALSDAINAIPQCILSLIKIVGDDGIAIGCVRHP
jgi:hypothetical protein